MFGSASLGLTVRKRKETSLFHSSRPWQKKWPVQTLANKQHGEMDTIWRAAKGISSCCLFVCIHIYV